MTAARCGSVEPHGAHMIARTGDYTSWCAGNVNIVVGLGAPSARAIPDPDTDIAVGGISGVPGAFRIADGEWDGDAVSVVIEDIADDERATVGQITISHGSGEVSSEFSVDEGARLIVAIATIIARHGINDRKEINS